MIRELIPFSKIFPSKFNDILTGARISDVFVQLRIQYIKFYTKTSVINGRFYTRGRIIRPDG